MQVHTYDVEFDILNRMWAPKLQGYIMNPDAQFALPLNQIILCVAETLKGHRFNVSEEIEKK